MSVIVRKFFETNTQLNHEKFLFKKWSRPTFLASLAYKQVKFVTPRKSSDLCRRTLRRKAGFPNRGQRTCSNGKSARKRLWRFH